MLSQDLPPSVLTPTADCIFTFGSQNIPTLLNWLSSGSLNGILDLNNSQKYKILEVIFSSNTPGKQELLESVLASDISDIAQRVRFTCEACLSDA
jgi:hypothetical protein